MPPVPTKTTHLAFLGCGFIAGVHSRHLASMTGIRRSYASRDPARAEEFRARYDGARAYAGYEAAIADPDVDAVVVAVPPAYHLDLTLAALAAGKHVLVEKPAFPRAEDFRTAMTARDAAQRVVLVGENDHYKPLAVTLRSMLADGGLVGMAGSWATWALVVLGLSGVATNQLAYHSARLSASMPVLNICLLYTSPSPRDRTRSRMPSSA